MFFSRNRSLATLITTIVLLLAASGGWRSSGAAQVDIQKLPIDQVPPHLRFRVIERTPESKAYHLAQLKKLKLKMSGRAIFRRFYLSGDSPESAKSGGLVHYHLLRPLSKVEDAEIRGYIDGRIVHHNINQGTANHFRIGRRFSGTEFGEFEVKRALIRWYLDNVPDDAEVKDAQVTLSAESIATVSPIVRKGHYLPLHLYMYPVAPIWVEGRGGSIHDNYTGVVKGEVTWVDARHEEQPWEFPGALDPGVMPLALGVYEKDASPVSFSSPLLTDHIQRQIRQGKNLDVVLKLDDEEEDRWGTEVGFYSSEFGDNKDIPDKRPRLDMTLALPHPVVEEEYKYSLEPGGEFVSKHLSHPNAKLLLVADFAADEQAENADLVYPDVWVRGGKGEYDEKAAWVRLGNPMEVEWDWSQFKLSTRLNELAEPQMRLTLPEYWVTARFLNLPHMLLLSPSGKVHETWALVPPWDPYTYVFAFPPDEPGLWRYIWFYLPTREVRLHTHENRGMFYAPAIDESK